MSRLRVTHLLLFVWVVLACLAPPAGAQGGAGDAEAARQLASAADDNAAGVEARREALGKLEQAARLALDAGEPLAAARALNRAGRLRLLLNEPQAALDAHRRALSLLEGAPSPEVEADGLSGMGEAYQHLRGEGVAALEALRRAVALSEQVGYTRGRAGALVTLSAVQCPDDHALGLRTAQEALVLWESLGDARGLARAHSQLGVCYLAQNLLAESERSYESARQIWRELKDESGQAEALIGLIFIEARRGEWRRHISLLTEAEGLIDEEAEPLKAGQIAASLGVAFRDSGSPEKGLPHIERALELYRGLDDPHLISYALWTLGRTHLARGDHPAALARFQEALEEALGESLVSPKVGVIDAAAAREYIGKVYIEMGDPAAALPYLQSALAAFEVSGNPGDVAEVRELLGKMFELRGQFGRARENYRAALEGFASLSDRVNQAGVYYDLGRLELGRGNYREAEGSLRRSVELTEALRRVPTGRDLTAAFSATVHERYEAYVECLMRLHAGDPSRGLAERAFESSESARARSLSELLRATETNLLPGLDPGLAERERSLRLALRVKEDERVGLLGRKYERTELAALEAELERLGAEYRSVEEAVRASNPAYVQVTSQAGWDLRRIREQVVADDETLLVEYSLGTERSYVWAVTRGGLVSHELPPRALIDGAADRVYRLLSARPREGGEEELALALRELSRMILSPVAEEMRGRRRVVVVADGALNYVPFQLLSASPGGGEEPLVATHEVVNAPSASVLGQLREEAARRRPRLKTLVAFGDPVFPVNYAMRKGGGTETAELRRAEDETILNRLRDVEVEGDSMDPATAQPLFFSAVELESLRGVAADEGSFVAAGFEATRERLQGTDLSEFAILHFATHGYLDPRHPENSGLLLSTVDEEGRAHGGFVGLRDIYSLRAPVELVVLSACRTALGKEVRGEGMIGLTRGFMYAGASSVVSSLWKVNDEATSELMKRFYENMLRRGMTPAAALGAAQNSIRQEPRWRSPHYWAAFTLQGEYRQVLRPAQAPGASLYTKAAVPAGVLSLLALAACAAWWFRRRRARVAL